VAATVIGLLLGRGLRLGDIAVQVPVSALVVIMLAQSVEPTRTYAVARVVDAALGFVVGLTVHILILPGLHLEAGRRALAHLEEEICSVLTTVSDGVRQGRRDGGQQWLTAARDLDTPLGEAQAALDRCTEAARWNVRAYAHRGELVALTDRLGVLRQVATQVRGISRTLRDYGDAASLWEDPDLARLLASAADAVRYAALPLPAQALPQSRPVEVVQDAAAKDILARSALLVDLDRILTECPSRGTSAGCQPAAAQAADQNFSA
jgi:uncharacterized membrane protein YccC